MPRTNENSKKRGSRDANADSADLAPKPTTKKPRSSIPLAALTNHGPDPDHENVPIKRGKLGFRSSSNSARPDGEAAFGTNCHAPFSDSDTVQSLVEGVDKLTAVVASVSERQIRLEELVENLGCSTQERLGLLEELVKGTARFSNGKLEMHTNGLEKGMENFRTTVAESIEKQSAQLGKGIKSFQASSEMAMNILNENVKRIVLGAEERIQGALTSATASTNKIIRDVSSDAVEQLTNHMRRDVMSLLNDVEKVLDRHRVTVQSSLQGTAGGDAVVAPITSKLRKLESRLKEIGNMVRDDLVTLGGELGGLTLLINGVKDIVSRMEHEREGPDAILKEEPGQDWKREDFI